MLYYDKLDKNEFFATGQICKTAIYEMMDKDVKTILDPCCGNGGLEKEGYTYTLYDIVDRGVNAEICDFLTKQYNNEQFDAVVCNPPFGQLTEFIKKCFLYSRDLYIIAPFRQIIKDYSNLIVDYRIDWKMPFMDFGVMASIGCFHLSLDCKSPKKVIFPEKIKNCCDKHFEYTDHCTQNKPFIVFRVTKPRVVRNEALFKDIDIYDANDGSAFIAMKSNKNTKKGALIKRWVLYFDTKDDALKFESYYNSDTIRNYLYFYAPNLLEPKHVPYLGEI